MLWETVCANRPQNSLDTELVIYNKSIGKKLLQNYFNCNQRVRNQSASIAKEKLKLVTTTTLQPDWDSNFGAT